MWKLSYSFSHCKAHDDNITAYTCVSWFAAFHYDLRVIYASCYVMLAFHICISFSCDGLGAYSLAFFAHKHTHKQILQNNWMLLFSYTLCHTLPNSVELNLKYLQKMLNRLHISTKHNIEFSFQTFIKDSIPVSMDWVSAFYG
jgi:hypothetical protein